MYASIFICHKILAKDVDLIFQKPLREDCATALPSALLTVKPFVLGLALFQYACLTVCGVIFYINSEGKHLSPTTVKVYSSPKVVTVGNGSYVLLAGALDAFRSYIKGEDHIQKLLFYLFGDIYLFDLLISLGQFLQTTLSNAHLVQQSYF